MDPYWLREIFQADDAVRRDFEALQWRLQPEPQPQPKEATMTDAQIKAEIEAARRRPVFTKAQIGGIAKFVSDYFHKRNGDEIGKLRGEINELRAEVVTLRVEISELRDDLVRTSALARGEIKELRSKSDAA